jgi:hypothetical protein
MNLETLKLQTLKTLKNCFQEAFQFSNPETLIPKNLKTWSLNLQTLKLKNLETLISRNLKNLNLDFLLEKT